MHGALAIQHLIENLPDSLSKRKAILADAIALLKDRDPLRNYLATMLQQIVAHEKLQAELPLNIDKLK